MIRIAMIHTVRSVYMNFEQQLRTALPGTQMKVSHVLDEFLVSDAAPSESGCFTLANKQRLLHQLQAAALTGADLILTTCSQLSVTAQDMAPFIGTPVLTIDGPMIETAVEQGRDIALISSAAGTVQPISETIMREAARQGKTVNLHVFCDDLAITALKAGDQAQHDKRICALAEQIGGCDNVILAQASGAHMKEPVEQITGLPVYTGLPYCSVRIEAFARRIEEEKGTETR
ncbi:MAG: aspartate/glutamate racemase family protein [Hominicoprocola sp.]